LYLAYQKFILLLNTHPILTLKVAIGDVWCKIDPRSNCHETCKLFDFQSQANF
jgi:hypothetical protein